MMEMTKERLQQIVHAAGLEPCDYEEVFDGITTGEIVMMARQLLASMEQEPVAYIDPFTFKNFATFRAGETDNKRMGREWVWANPDAGLIPLYAAPQLPQQEVK